jgi:retron-type reverse transcriptase
MKRTLIELSSIATYENLALATWKAARGKRHRPDVICFTSNLDQSLAQLAQDILQNKAPYGRYRAFTIHDPKQRLIHAACFEDRVLHHAIMNLAEPVFEKSLIATSYACRPNKGVHLACKRVQRNLRRYAWYVKTDISAYFPNIDHFILYSLLEKRFKGRGFLQLLWRIISSYNTQTAKGLPIGSLTSQHFANFFLSGVDRFLTEQLKVCAHVRYMDDLLFWCETYDLAKQTLDTLQAYLWEKRKLIFKENTQINRSSHGISYCGYRILKGTIRLSHRKQKRYRLLLQQQESLWQKGVITEVELQSAYASIYAITLHADSRQWRKKYLQSFPSLYT